PWSGTWTASAPRRSSTSVPTDATPPLMPRLAVTLGDPRGIGPEITARALAEDVGAEITLIGADDQIAAIPAARRVSVGTWNAGSGETADHQRILRAGRITGHAVEAAV